jgi:hypothetical protein
VSAGPFSVVIAVMSLPCGLTSGEGQVQLSTVCGGVTSLRRKPQIPLAGNVASRDDIGQIVKA